jgi:hypothetical protein
MMNTERGYAVAKTATGEGWSGGEAAKTLEYQASHFVRQILVDQLCGVRFSSWYEWGGNEGFGLWNPDGSPRPVVAAIKELVSELGGYRIVERLASDSKLDYVLLCATGKGDRKLVVWTAPPAGGAPEETWEHDVALDMGAGGEPLALKLTGRPKYVAVPAGAKPGKSVTTSTRPFPESEVVALPEGGIDLKLFDSDAKWNFIKNTGEGSFELGKDADGNAVGTLSYDFTKSTTGSTPYVLASTPVSIPGGAEIVMSVRTDVPQKLTFRVVDNTGQTLQIKTKTKVAGVWQSIRLPLNKKLEHWDGANDGKVHFPLKSLAFSVPQPGDTKVGKVEYTAAFAK